MKRQPQGEVLIHTGEDVRPEQGKVQTADLVSPSTHLAEEVEFTGAVPYDHAHALPGAVELEDVEDLVIHVRSAPGSALSDLEGHVGGRGHIGYKDI